jgi:hypothetical protein
LINSIYKKNETIPAFDVDISNALSDYGVEGGGKKLITVVENYDGRIYRVISSVGMGAYMHVITSLLEIGLKDILADDLEGRDGYDSWFKTTPAMQSLVPAPIIALTPIDDPVSDVLNELALTNDITETQRQTIIQSRIGQGEFRTKLISYWKECAVTGANCIKLLQASHIKPWRSSNNVERLDVFNGLLLAPNIDAAFDSGSITFDSKGKIIISKSIAGMAAFQLHINLKLSIKQKLLSREHMIYLEYHRNEVFHD